MQNLKENTKGRCRSRVFCNGLCTFSSNKERVSAKKLQTTYTDAVIIGNGPSGICLSYLLSGYWPYYNGDPHPNEYLNTRLQVEPDKSLVQQDLKFLSDNLEGRSSNPVSLLFDALSNPDADLGIESPSVLRWEHHRDNYVPHVVLGKKEEGGIWQMMEGHMRTLSLSSWMQLPDMSFEKWLDEHRSSNDPEVVSNRASMEEVRKYYTEYVHAKGLKKNFVNHSTVTSVQRVQECVQSVDDESGEECVNCDDTNDIRCPMTWLVCGQRVAFNDALEPEMEEFCYKTPRLVLANGASDQPNVLRIEGEHLPFVVHSHSELERFIKTEEEEEKEEEEQRTSSSESSSDPYVVIGAGLSAADAILHLLSLNIPVVHIFRRNADDPQIVFRQLPPKLYPEYHKIYHLMQRRATDDLYRSYSTVDILEFTADREVILRNRYTGLEMVLRASCVAVLIGSRPDLSFLPSDIALNLGVVPRVQIHGQHNPVDVDPYTCQSNRYLGLYAMGPLIGDHFVRFLRGGALAIASHILEKKDVT